jgi:peptidoglycan/xylan/chitin deacetylase (PgdA/CDA1 family)
MSYRIVVFTGKLAHSVRKGIAEIDRSIPDLSWLVLVHTPKRSAAKLLRNQWRNLKRNGWRWIAYQTTDIYHRLAVRKSADEGGKSIGYESTLSALRSRPNLRLIEVEDLHAESTLQAVKEFAPDIGLSLAAPILRRSLFSIPRLGTLNLHKGKLPEYRGMPPAFWELWNDENSVGCSIHWVDDKLDTGALVKQHIVAREKFSTVRGLQLALDEVGVSLMRNAVMDVLQGSVSSLEQAHGGKTYRKPTLAQVAKLDEKIRRQQPVSSSAGKQLVKNAVAEMAFRAWRAGLSRLVTPRLTVLLYHRVTDTARDNLTVGVEQFDRQMEMLAKYCHVVSIEEAISYRVIPKTSKPLVCVTFDDGYLDNYTHAAPIMVRHQVPGAFFVSTGIIDRGGRFPHDLRRGNPVLPVMNWQQVGELKAQGFTIGSHSVNHIDCASEPEETVWDELVQSAEDLRRQLGLAEVIFAYPYGGRQHMTPERLSLVKRAGYAACLSAYGGTNVGTIDSFNVLRRGIHWEFSDQSFLLECLGLT